MLVVIAMIDNNPNIKPSNRIKAYLVALEITMEDIARDVGVTKTLVSYVINGQRHNERVRVAIADRLGKTVEDLWGGEPKKKAA